MSPRVKAKSESAMRTVLAFNEAFNRHDVEGMMKWMSTDCVFENTAPAPDGTRFVGAQAVKGFWTDFFNQSNLARIKIEELFGWGERCIMRWRYSWESLEGEPGSVRGVDIFLVREGLIQEKLSYVKG